VGQFWGLAVHPLRDEVIKAFYSLILVLFFDHFSLYLFVDILWFLLFYFSLLPLDRTKLSAYGAYEVKNR
jgi:hypothetical protein